jgi:cell division protein ZapE
MPQVETNRFYACYDARVREGAWRDDPAQRHAAQALAALYSALEGKNNAPRSLVARLFGGRDEPIYGLYLWGDVGRGKSMLMDLFVEEIAHVRTTRRVHFHAFMLDVHKRLFAYRQLDSSGDVMPKVIHAIAGEMRVLCLDELQVTDVTDAMILARLFAGLMDAGVSVVFTSNRPPQQLYQGGLQREQFLQFIALVQQRLTIVELKSPTDYRLEQLRAMQRTYCTPPNDDFLLESWQRLSAGAPSEPLQLEVQGRILRVDKQAKGVAWLTFDELCRRPLGANDYLTLAKVCHTLLLQGIPAMTLDDRNEAKRFVTLIDALYEAKVKMICTAATPPEGIYPSGDGAFEFHRTVSRLMEMQSEKYLALPHLSA